MITIMYPFNAKYLAMHCFIYKSLKKQQLYLFIKQKDDFTCIPEALFNSLGQLELIIEMDLTPERKLAKEDAARVIASLNDKGYFIQWPPTSLSAFSTLQ